MSTTAMNAHVKIDDESIALSKKKDSDCCVVHPISQSVYLVFAVMSAYTTMYLSDRDWSALIAADYALQALATVQLLVNVHVTGSMKGISVGMLQALAMSYAFRLSSTVWLQGYLPTDRTGNWFCQVMDLTSLACVLYLLQRAYGADRDAQELEADRLPMRVILFACLVIGAFCHADLDLRPLFDTLWTAGFLASCIAPLPQFVVTLTCEGSQPLTTHFTAPLTLATAATAAFWIYGCLELTEYAPKRTVWCIAGGVAVQVTLTWCLLIASTRFARSAAASIGIVSHIELGAKVPLFDV